MVSGLNHGRKPMSAELSAVYHHEYDDWKATAGWFDNWPGPSKKVLAGGLRAGDIVFTTFNGKTTQLGERGVVLGPSKKAPDEKVLVRFVPSAQPDHLKSWTWMTDAAKELVLNASTQLRPKGYNIKYGVYTKKKKSATVSATQASKLSAPMCPDDELRADELRDAAGKFAPPPRAPRGPQTPETRPISVLPTAIAQVTAAIHPLLPMTCDIVRDVAPELFKALGLNRTGASLARCSELVNTAPDVFGKLIAGACKELSRTSFVRKALGVAAEEGMNIALDGGLDWDKLTAFGFLWTLAKLSGLRDVFVTVAKLPCLVLKQLVTYFIPLGGKLFASIDFVAHIPMKIIETTLENFAHPLMMGADGALVPVVGLCGGVVRTVGVLPLVVGQGVEGVISLSGDGIVTILDGTGEVVEAILGPLGTPIKLTVNLAGATVDVALKATGAIVGGVLAIPYSIGKVMMGVMD